MRKIAIFASGNGSNFEEIAKYKNKYYKVVLLICDKENAYVLDRAKRLNIPSVVVIPKNFSDKSNYETVILNYLIQYKVDFIVLAGYMRLIGHVLLSKYQNKIVNIHPSLLPAFKGLNAIEQAIHYGVKVTGVTIHYIDEGMDTGKIIAQKAVKIDEDMNLDKIKMKIQKVEHRLYKKVIEEIIRKEDDCEESISECI